MSDTEEDMKHNPFNGRLTFLKTPYARILKDGKPISVGVKCPFPKVRGNNQIVAFIFLNVDYLGPNTKLLIEAIDDFLPAHNPDANPIVWSSNLGDAITAVVFTPADLKIIDENGERAGYSETDYFSALRGKQVKITCLIQLNKKRNQPTLKVTKINILGPAQEEEEEEEDDEHVVCD